MTQAEIDAIKKTVKDNKVKSEKLELNELQIIETLSHFMDDAFQVPGTKFKFGLDPLINLIPGAGSLIGYVFSACLVLVLIKRGASSGLVAKMVGNVILDSAVGAIPFIGNIWDFGYKANRRNLNLMKEHYDEKKHQGSVVPLLFGTLLLFVFIFVALFIGLGFLISYLFSFIF